MVLLEPPEEEGQPHGTVATEDPSHSQDLSQSGGGKENKYLDLPLFPPLDPLQTAVNPSGQTRLEAEQGTKGRGSIWAGGLGVRQTEEIQHVRSAWGFRGGGERR